MAIMAIWKATVIVERMFLLDVPQFSMPHHFWLSNTVAPFCFFVLFWHLLINLDVGEGSKHGDTALSGNCKGGVPASRSSGLK